ncbi:hypothetical protein F5880DRAFT_1512748, partial [Lentinula raphanica]
DWVHPQWKKAALERADILRENELKEQRRLQELLSHAANISHTGANDLQISYESEDELDPKPQSSLLRKTQSSRLATLSPDWTSAGIGGATLSDNEVLEIMDHPGVLVLDQVWLPLSLRVQLQPSDDRRDQSRKDDNLKVFFDPNACQSSALKKYAPSSPVQHALLPFDFRGLSEEAQHCLVRAKDHPKCTVDQALLKIFNPTYTILINPAYIQEVWRTLGYRVSGPSLYAYGARTVSSSKGGAVLPIYIVGIESAISSQSTTQPKFAKPLRKHCLILTLSGTNEFRSNTGHFEPSLTTGATNDGIDKRIL